MTALIRNSAPHLNDRETVVYRCYDTAGVLLYIGATVDIKERLKNHRYASDWFPNVARVTTEPYPDRVAALKAELNAIAVEQPAFNRFPMEAAIPLPPIEPHLGLAPSVGGEA